MAIFAMPGHRPTSADSLACFLRLAALRSDVWSHSLVMFQLPAVRAALASATPSQPLPGRLSRLARSIKNLLELSVDLDSRGIGLVVLKQDIDTSTATGRLIVHILASIDEIQRELIVEGTREGLAVAREQGKVRGRPAKLSPEDVKAARVLRDSGPFTMREIAARYCISRGRLYAGLGSESE